MIYQLIQMNYVPVLLCVLFAAYIMVDKCIEDTIRKKFFVTVSVILVLVVIDDMEYIELKKDHPTVLRYIEMSLGYIIRPLIAILVTKVFQQSNQIRTSIRKRVIYYLPYLGNLICVSLSPLTKMVYSFSEDNQFQRGPLGYITFVVGFYYMGFMVITCLKRVKIRKKGEAAVMIMLAFLCVVSTMLESWFLFVGFLSGASIIGVVLYYLYLHVSIYSMDSLTGAYNRRIFYLDMEKINQTVTLVSIDLNNLKKINDTEGHAKGDEFIVFFSNQILKLKTKGTHFYRLGGDEFVLLYKSNNQKTAKRQMEEIQKHMNERGYSFAYGIRLYHPEEDVKTVMDQVDQMMYEKKLEMKRTETNNQVL